jgi:hypothetical protein
MHTFTNILGDPDITYPSSGSMLVDQIGTGGAGGNNIDQTQYRVVVTDVCSNITSLPATITVNDITTITPSILTPSITALKLVREQQLHIQ